MINQKPLKNLSYHLIGVVSFVFSELVVLFFHESQAHFWELIVFYTIDLAFFYLSTYWFIEVVKKQKIKIDFRFTGFSLLWILLFTLIDMWFTNNQYTIRDMTMTRKDITMYFTKLFCRFFYFYLLAYGFWAARRLIKRERENRENEIALLKSENEKAQIELALLRAQITPHLLLNTLNGIYNLVMPTNPKAAVLVELLMDNLKLSLKGSQPDKVTTLADEIQLIKNLVRLNAQLGKSNCEIKIILDSDIQQRPFPVNIIATMVENLFKHGDLSDPALPAKITIRNEGAKLLVRLYNKVNPTRHTHKSGIGMANIEKRLTLLFKDRYELGIANTKEYYQIDFQIEI